MRVRLLLTLKYTLLEFVHRKCIPFFVVFTTYFSLNLLHVTSILNISTHDHLVVHGHSFIDLCQEIRIDFEFRFVIVILRLIWYYRWICLFFIFFDLNLLRLY